MSSGFFLLFLALTLSSCTSRLTNSHEATAVDCQIHRDAARGSYLQVLDPTGHPLNPDQVSNLTTEFLNARGFLSHPRLTPGACVELPDEPGQLAVVDVKSKASLYWASAGKNPLLLKRPLLKPTKLSYDSLCAGENRFANTQLKRDWNVSSDGPLPHVRIRVQARNVHDDRTFPLFQKDFGEELQLPEYWSTADLKEGQYQLEVLQQELIHGLETAATPVSFPAQCPVTVLHHAPTLLGLTDGSITIPVVDADQGLDWNASAGSGSVFVCMEERSTLPQDFTQGQSCEASAACRDPAHFKVLEQTRSVRDGIYNVFAFAQDKADNRGVTQCRTMIFSSQAPQFNVRWVKEKWNREGAVLDETPAILKAKIVGLSHPKIPIEKLGLECKVEVILHSVETVTTPRLTCASGLCKGQPLDVYRPCDTDIGIGIYEFWKSSYSSHATLRLKVRASDNAQHMREKSLSLVVDSGQWTREPLVLPDPITLAPNQLVEDESGNILGLGSDSVMLWKDEILGDITPGPSRIQPLRSKDNEVYFFTRESSNTLQILRWEAGTWKSVGTPLNLSESSSILTHIHPRKGFWIHSADHSYLIQGDQLVEVSAIPEDFILDTRFSIDESNRIWACFRDQVFYQDPAGPWIPFAVPNKNTSADQFEYMYHVDGKSNLWMIVGDKSSDPTLLKDVVRIDGAGEHSYPELVRKVSSASRIAEDFILDARFVPLIGNYIWADETQNWQLNPLLDGIADHIDVGVLWNGRELAWTTQEGRVYLEHNGQLQHLPLAMSIGESPFITRNRDVFVTGFFGYSRIRWNPWVERNAGHEDLENVFGLWPSKNGSLQACSRKAKLWELRDGIWSARMDLSGTDSGMAFACYENARSDLFMHTSNAMWWLPSGETKPIRLADSAKGKGPDGFVEDTKGTIWFACLDKVGKASLCSFDRKTVTFHPLLRDQFRSSHGRFCALNIDRTFYMVGDDFKMAYDQTGDVLRTLESSEVIFPDGSQLTLDRCYAMPSSSSYLIRSDGVYHLWNNKTAQLKILDELDSGISESWLMPEQDSFQPAADGYLYFSALSAGKRAGGDQVSDKIREGSVFRLAPDGTLKEILKRDIRLRALDQMSVMPEMFVTDTSGRLWNLSISEIYWNQRLIQFTVPIP